MKISERIFKLLLDKGISQIEFSKRTGISQSTISDWKRKGTNPSSDKILTICRILEISPYELLQDSDSELVADKTGYMVISTGSDAYELVTEFNNLDSDRKNRLLGYLKALSI